MPVETDQELTYVRKDSFQDEVISYHAQENAKDNWKFIFRLYVDSVGAMNDRTVPWLALAKSLYADELRRIPQYELFPARPPSQRARAAGR